MYTKKVQLSAPVIKKITSCFLRFSLDWLTLEHKRARNRAARPRDVRDSLSWHLLARFLPAGSLRSSPARRLLTGQNFDLWFLPKGRFKVLSVSFGFHDPPLLTFKTDRVDLRGLDPGKSHVKGSPAYSFSVWTQLIIYAKRKLKSLKAQNSCAAFKFCNVHTHCILKLVSHWRHFLLDPDLSRTSS